MLNNMFLKSMALSILTIFAFKLILTREANKPEIKIFFYKSKQ